MQGGDEGRPPVEATRAHLARSGSDRGEHKVVVEERRPHRLLRLEILEPIEEFIAGELRFVPDRVMARDAGPMRQHVAERHAVVQLLGVEPNGGHRFTQGLGHVSIPSSTNMPAATAVNGFVFYAMGHTVPRANGSCFS